MINDRITLYIPHSSIVPSGAVPLTDVIDKRTRSNECRVDSENYLSRERRPIGLAGLMGHMSSL